MADRQTYAEYLNLLGFSAYSLRNIPPRSRNIQLFAGRSGHAIMRSENLPVSAQR
jgi:hypothetical protein